MTPCCPQSTWSCCCSSINFCACGYGTLTCSLDVLPCPGPTVMDSLLHLLSLTLNDRLWKANWHLLLRCWPVTPSITTAIIIIWPCWSSMNVWTFWQCSVIISTRASQKRSGHHPETGSSLGFFLGSSLSREFFLATVLLHLHCLLFGVLGWVSVQHFVTSADVKRAL